MQALNHALHSKHPRRYLHTHSISAAEALEHPYLADVRDRDNEPEVALAYVHVCVCVSHE